MCQRGHNRCNKHLSRPRQLPRNTHRSDTPPSRNLVLSAGTNLWQAPLCPTPPFLSSPAQPVVVSKPTTEGRVGAGTIARDQQRNLLKASRPPAGPRLAPVKVERCGIGAACAVRLCRMIPRSPCLVTRQKSFVRKITTVWTSDRLSNPKGRSGNCLRGEEGRAQDGGGDRCGME